MLKRALSLGLRIEAYDSHPESSILAPMKFCKRAVLNLCAKYDVVVIHTDLKTFRHGKLQIVTNILIYTFHILVSSKILTRFRVIQYLLGAAVSETSSLQNYRTQNASPTSDLLYLCKKLNKYLLF